jgi:hypothetical protein
MIKEGKNKTTHWYKKSPENETPEENIQKKENVIKLRKNLIKKMLPKKGINIPNGNELNSLVEYILHAQNNNKSLTFNNILNRKNKENLNKALNLSKNKNQPNNNKSLNLNSKLYKHYLKHRMNL